MTDLHRVWSGGPWSAEAGPIGPSPAPGSGEERGAGDVILYCWATDPDQVDRLSDAIR
jgi:hypothetical protein